MPASGTAFVTGGTGFIGSHLVEHLLETGHEEVRCLVRSREKWLHGMNIVTVPGALDDREALSKGCANADVVYHLAGLTRARRWEAFRETNIEATRRLLDVVHEAQDRPRRIVITSSLAVIGTGTGGLATETTPLRPVSPYGRSKAQMEEMVAAYKSEVPVTMIRPPSVYGPRDTDILTYFRAMKYGLCPVVGDPERAEISLVHARDLVRGIVQAAGERSAEGETYFVGSDRAYAWTDIKAAASRAFNRPTLTLRVPRRAVKWAASAAELAGRMTNTYPPFNREKARELLHACKMCAVDKAREDFGYEPRISLREGVAETITWYREHGWL